MARAPAPVEAAPEVDALDDLPLPRERRRLIGHHAAETTLLDAYRSGRMHHGWIMSGPKGIGKATLAFRFARFVLAHPDPRLPAVERATTLDIGVDQPAFSRVAAGTHGGLVHLRRVWDDKGKRFKQDLPVDEVRRAKHFFEATSAEGGWRVAIIDPADDLNTSSSNALLKLLEEPPARALFLVLAHRPGALLPTIRSRCRLLRLRELTPAEIVDGLVDLGLDRDTNRQVLVEAAELADGSLRRAVQLIRAGAIAHVRQTGAFVEALPRLDTAAFHAAADRVAARNADDLWDITLDALRDAVARRVKASATLAGANRLAEAMQAVERDLAATEALNLDRKATFLAALRTLAAGTA